MVFKFMQREIRKQGVVEYSVSFSTNGIPKCSNIYARSVQQLNNKILPSNYEKSNSIHPDSIPSIALKFRIMANDTIQLYQS